MTGEQTPRAEVFDLDYTLLRPSDQFEAPGYVRTGDRYGLRPDAAGRRRSAPPAWRPRPAGSRQASSTTTVCYP